MSRTRLMFRTVGQTMPNLALLTFSIRSNCGCGRFSSDPPWAKLLLLLLLLLLVPAEPAGDQWSDVVTAARA